MDEMDEKQQLRFACLEMACRQTKLLTNETSGDHYSTDLNASEAVAMAEEFYKFVTKKELN